MKLPSASKMRSVERSFTSCIYESEHDLHLMYDLLMQARVLTSDWRYAHVGELAFNFFMVACHLNPQEHIRLWHAGGKLVAYAILGEDPAFDCQVFPGYEWSGIEEEALAWAERRVDELRQQDAERWGCALVSSARQDDSQRIAFLERHGFPLLRRLCRGQYADDSLLDEPIPEAGVMDGYQVRPVAEIRRAITASLPGRPSGSVASVDASWLRQR